MTPVDPFRLDGKRVLVTGASSGIGRACCLRIAEAGGVVLAVGRDGGRLRETVEKCVGTGHEILPLDLTDDTAVEAAVRAKEFPVLDGVVHSAGRCAIKLLRFTKPGEFDDMLGDNTATAFDLSARILAARKLAPGSSIVFIASVSGLIGEAGMVGYAASKGAVIAGARSLALELAKQGIRVNCVAPGSVRTPLLDALEEQMTDASKQANAAAHPLGIGTVVDVACAVNYLLAPAARWVTGTTLVVDGGLTAG